MGRDWLASRKAALLADQMGLGKSAQVITACDKIGAKRILVICPAVARLNWLREFDKFSTSSRQFTVAQSSRDTIPDTHSIVASYDLASRIDPTCLGRFDVVILDEVHYCKNHKAKRTKALFSTKGIIHGQAKETRIWVLSGTPAPNHAGELWVLLYSFKVTALSYTDFCQRFCNVIPSIFRTGLQITGTKKSAIPELRKILNGIMLRRMKDEVAEQLPKIFYSNIVVEAGVVDLECETFVKYVFPKDRVHELEAKLKEEVAAVNKVINTNDVEVLKGLAKSVATLRRYIGVQKVEKIAELVKGELDSGLYDKIVIFAIHRDVIEGLRVRLKDYGALTLYGGTRFDSANQNIDKFQRYDKFKVFIANITAAGIAINLTAAHNVLFIEQEWTPAANAQAVARCHRHGQTRPVTVRMAGLVNSLDERISKLLKKKTEELTQIFDGDKSKDITITDLLE